MMSEAVGVRAVCGHGDHPSIISWKELAAAAATTKLPFSLY